MEKENIKELYLKWIKAQKKTEDLRKALNNLEKIAKKFTNADIITSSSIFDGVYIIWENYDICGIAKFYNPQDFINACKNRDVNEKTTNKKITN